jgi:phenylpropionate dioxygenase-like ring-hydroxylating dioxygenase large terminal subunit
LRCLYHGWVFDVTGKCLETPAEPDNSKLKDHVRAVSYPCLEKSGLIFAYMGEGETPPFPDYEFLKYEGVHRYLTRTYVDCNWLQALEGDIDPSHLSYLHRPVGRVDRRAVPGSDKSADQYYAGDTRPKLEWERTHYGLRIFSVRKSGEDKKYVRITNFVMPNKAAIVGNEGRIGEGYSVNWHVPIDDVTHLRFDITFNRVRPINAVNYGERMAGEVTSDGRLIRTPANRYLQNRAEMKTTNFTGMGGYFITHDSFAVQSAGSVHDRTREHLGTTDIMIAQARRLLLDNMKAMEEGKEPIHVDATNISDLMVCSVVVPASLDHKDIDKLRTPTEPKEKTLVAGE